MRTLTSCPVCAAAGLREAFSVRDHSTSGEVFTLQCCGNCGFLLTNPAPAEEEIGPYYDSEAYISHTNQREGLFARTYQLARRWMSAGKRRMVQRELGRREGALLDLGAGTGEFLQTMRAAGWETLGLEPSERARANARDLHGLAMQPPEHLFELPEASFDVITLWHVLEHIHRLHDSLAAFHRLLKPGGVLLVAVPNHRSLDREHYGEDWAAWDVPIHLYHFEPATMERLIQRFGFQVDGLHRLPFDPFYVSLLSEQYRHGRMRPVAAFWTGLRSTLASWRDIRRSSSLVYVIRREGEQRT